MWRPAKVTSFELQDGSGQRVTAVVDGAKRTASCRWVVDATGSVTMFARKLGHFRPNTDHPINAVWARFSSGVKEWDSYEWRERLPDYASRCRTAREWAKNHLFGRGWWVCCRNCKNQSKASMENPFSDITCLRFGVVNLFTVNTLRPNGATG